MLKIKTFVGMWAVLGMFLNSASASELADGNASIGCNLQHGTNYKDIQEAEDIVAYVTNVSKAKEVETQDAGSVE